eukprot:TRINITY_DN22812_c0_g1_i1.p1 TRINITY_DN22812_c0_g1~~TRINITY_DN22812_c0_g1_i1.p1  ORF type:complete len:455 (+),score=53.96 TRINITY_DN22812_c0_g1_i1:59-1366(+)
MTAQMAVRDDLGVFDEKGMFGGAGTENRDILQLGYHAIDLDNLDLDAILADGQDKRLQNDVVEYMQLFLKLSASDRWDDATKQAASALLGSTDLPKLKQSQNIATYLTLNSIHLLEDWHGAREVARRAIERALAHRTKPRISRLVTSFLFGFCKCHVCQGKVAVPLSFTMLGMELYVTQLMCPSNNTVEAASNAAVLENVQGKDIASDAERPHLADLDPPSVVIQQVHHEEPPAHIDEDVARSSVQQEEDERFASIVEAHIRASDDGSGDAQRYEHDADEHASQQEGLVLLEFAQRTREALDELQNGPTFHVCRQGLQDHGFNCVLPGGTLIFCAPSQYRAAQQLLIGRDLQRRHVLVTESLEYLVEDALLNIPCRQRPSRNRKRDVVGPLPCSVVVATSRTFIGILQRQLDASAVVQSTPTAPNPRRITIPNMD